MAKPVLVIASPAPSLVHGDITLDRATWHGHIQKYHPEVPLWQIEDTLTTPDYIAASTTVPGDYVFICEGNTGDNQDPLVVTVRTVPDGSNIVTTAYYDQNYSRHQPKLWSKP